MQIEDHHSVEGLGLGSDTEVAKVHRTGNYYKVRGLYT